MTISRALQRLVRRVRPIEFRRGARDRLSGVSACALVLGLGLALGGLFPFGRARISVAAETISLSDCIRGFESSYRNVRTLRAAFTQEYSAWDRTRVESGEVYLERGGKMRWEYQKPERKLFLSDGRNVQLYVPSEKQLTRTPMKSSDDARVPLELLVSHLNLRRAFSKIEFANSAAPADPGDLVLRAYPKHGYEGEYKDLLIELTPAFDIRRLVITYPDQTSMQFSFDGIARNVPLTPSLFEFTPPAGTEVIQQ